MHIDNRKLSVTDRRRDSKSRIDIFIQITVPRPNQGCNETERKKRWRDESWEDIPRFCYVLAEGCTATDSDVRLCVI